MEGVFVVATIINTLDITKAGTVKIIKAVAQRFRRRGVNTRFALKSGWAASTRRFIARRIS